MLIMGVLYLIICLWNSLWYGVILFQKSTLVVLEAWLKWKRVRGWVGMWEFPDLSLNRDKMFSIPTKKNTKITGSFSLTRSTLVLLLGSSCWIWFMFLGWDTSIALVLVIVCISFFLNVMVSIWFLPFNPCFKPLLLTYLRASPALCLIWIQAE